MRRRDFIALVGATSSIPLVAGAQQNRPVIGFLDSGTPTGMEANLAGFRLGLAEAGFTEGENVVTDGQNQLRPGAKISPRPPTGDAPASSGSAAPAGSGGPRRRP